jgi:amidase
VGLKPSRHRTSPAPLHGEYWGPLTHEHVLTRSVRDSAAFLDATAGAVPGDLHTAPPPLRTWLQEVDVEPGRLRVGIVVDRPDEGQLDEECRRAVELTGRLLEHLGHAVEQVEAPWLRDDAGSGGFTTLLAVAVAHDLRHWERVTGQRAELEPFPAMLAEMGRGVLAVDLVAATDAVAAWSRRIAAGTAAVDVLLTPTIAVRPPLLGVMSADRPLEDSLPVAADMSLFALPFNVSGQPAISLPLHRTPGGLPIGVQLVAAYGREDLVLSLAGQLERAAPWAARLPPVDGAAPASSR